MKKEKKKAEKIKHRLVGLAVFAVWLALWQLLFMLAEKTGIGLLVPSPYQVLEALAELLQTADFYVSCGVSMLRVTAAWGLGLVTGVLLAALTHRFSLLRRFFAPAVSAVKATPVASFIILALVLMKAGAVPVFTGALMSLPIVWANVSGGLNAVDPKLSEMANAFGMSPKNRLFYLTLPALKPYFTVAATTAMGLTWKACIAAEVISIPRKSIGENLYNAKVYFETPALFAWTLAVILLSVSLEKLLLRVLKGGKTG